MRSHAALARLAPFAVLLPALGFLIAGPAGDKVFSGVTITGGIGVISYIGLLLLWISALVTLYTGYDYFRAGIRHIMSEDT